MIHGWSMKGVKKVGFSRRIKVFKEFSPDDLELPIMYVALSQQARARRNGSLTVWTRSSSASSRDPLALIRNLRRRFGVMSEEQTDRH